MSNNTVKYKYVNVVPAPKIKIEISSDDEALPCPMCPKEFASANALRNHGRSEHIAVFMETPDVFKPSGSDGGQQRAKVKVKPAIQQVKQQKVKAKVAPKKALVLSKSTYSNDLTETIKQREKALLSSMQPSSLKELARTDVEYIIVKAEKEEVSKTKTKNFESVDIEVPPKETSTSNKVADPIAGPFECLQPSALVADGVCHQIFFSCCEYSAHYRDEHTRRRKGNRCQVCEKPLVGDGLDAPYNCMVCGAGFDTNKELSEHTTTNHVKLKPFACSVCHKRFTQQGGVQQHMRMHTGARPFNCTFCPKAFTQKSGLDQHLRIHTKEKPYRCVICSKTFCQSVHLKQHMRTHTNVSPFECGICGKRFKQSSHLNYHLKNHNLLNMTDEQRERYEGLIREIRKADENKSGTVMTTEGREVVRRKPKKVVLLSQENGGLIAIDEDDLQQFVVNDGEVSMDLEESVNEQQGYEEQEELDEEEERQETQQMSEEELQEQLLAEQSIAVEVDAETYILGDVDQVETWQVDSD